MLTVDGQPISSLPKTNEARQEYERILKELEKEYGKAVIVLKTNRQRTVYENGYIEQPNFTYIPTKTAYTPANSTLQQEWRYYANPADARNPNTPAKYLWDSETIHIPYEKRDLAAFLIYMLHYENGNRFYGSLYEVFSTKAVDDAIADKYKQEADLTFYIFGDNPVAKDIDRLIKIGQSLGMAEFKYDRNTMNENTVRRRLFEYVKEGEDLGIKGRNISAFLNAISAHIDTDMRAFIQLCFDKEILKLEANNEIYLYNGKEEELFLRVSDSNQEGYISQLSNYIKANESKRRELEVLSGETAVANADFEWEDIRNMTYKGLKSICKIHKLKTGKDDTAEELRNLIVKTFGIQRGE